MNSSPQPHTLIVGGTRGIGRAVAAMCLNEGHRVSVIGRRVPAEPLASVHYQPIDLLDTQNLAHGLDQIISTQGKLSNLIFLQRFKNGSTQADSAPTVAQVSKPASTCSAGAATNSSDLSQASKPADRSPRNDSASSPDTWTGEIETSLSATKSVIEALLPHFTDETGKSIVLVSSAASDVVADEQGVGYHVAKAGLKQMARYYAVVLGPKGFRVNVVSPGTVLKQENRDFYLKNDKLQNLFKRTIPLGRMGTAEEVANVILFLCSSKASFVTGQTILVDGGVNLVSTETLARKLTDQP